MLKTLLRSGIRCQISDRVPYFETCGDFFARFVDQFESVSYGNKLFINYLLVFLQMKCSPLFKTKMFTEFVTTFRIIRLPFEEISIPMNDFLMPIESDCQTLEAYLKALLCGALQPKESPIMYLIAVHHLNHRLFRGKPEFSPKDKPIFDRLIRSVHNSKNDLLRQHLLRYSHFDPKQPYGMAISA
ncbi:unnamed protein product [Oppiella nova]|uniref:RPAP1/MINIYO-like TPR repeats domain-containing protein n=1 Tax=Oppiella nova TaxID=334625 RepID=A0A7R9M6T2_9ACAR|nr:unnamed protein product [Oppiella nova]CAG2171842.1 unnamed protein product [Oppiella nova]